MESLESIAPKSKERLIDLVEVLGLDVSDWANFKGGPSKASANPKYCYEWVFIVPNSLLILNLWHEDCLIRGVSIVQEHNFRQLAESNSKRGKGIQAKRARAVDNAVRTAIGQRLEVRVILQLGKAPKWNDQDSPSSLVRKRQLDSRPWAITAYDNSTGACVLTRGSDKPIFVDQFSAPELSRPEPGSDAPAKKLVTGFAYPRDPKVREDVLLRACGRCEYCGVAGFLTNSGAVYLETHHIIPLSESGPDRVHNVIALCPNHHREAHHGVQRDALRQLMQLKVAKALAA